MGNPYSSKSIGATYNQNPPADDGTQTEANRVKFATVKTKLSDPIKAFGDAINAELLLAFAKMPGGGGVTSVSTTYTVQTSDQGNLIVVSAAVTVTTPAAATVGSPFVFAVVNNHTAAITIDGNASETIDGNASVSIQPDGGAFFFTDGSNWFTAGKTLAASETVAGVLEIATQAEMEAGTETDKAVTPANVNHAPGVAKFHIKCDAGGNINSSHNVTSITDVGTGLVDITLATDFADGDWACIVSIETNSNILGHVNNGNQGAGTVRLEALNASTAAASDPTSYYAAGFGDQA